MKTRARSESWEEPLVVHSTHTKFSKKVYRYRKIFTNTGWIMIAIQKNLLKNVFIALFFPFLAHCVLFKEMEKDYIIVTSLLSSIMLIKNNMIVEFL